MIDGPFGDYDFLDDEEVHGHGNEEYENVGLLDAYMSRRGEQLEASRAPASLADVTAGPARPGTAAAGMTASTTAAHDDAAAPSSVGVVAVAAALDAATTGAYAAYDKQQGVAIHVEYNRIRSYYYMAGVFAVGMLFGGVAMAVWVSALMEARHGSGGVAGRAALHGRSETSSRAAEIAGRLFVITQADEMQSCERQGLHKPASRR